MAASATDKFKKLTNNFSTTLSSSIGSTDTTIPLTSVTNLPTDTGIVLVIDRVNSAGTLTPAFREYVKGTISSTNLINVVRGIGGSSGLSHTSGATIEQVVDQTTINDLMDGILAQHNQDGTHAAVTATSVASAGTVTGTTGVFSSDVSDNATTLKTIRSENTFDFVASGCVWSGDAYGSTKAASMTAGVVYIGGKRVAVSAVTARTFTASKDVYVDVDNTGTLTYTDNTTNAASPALAANSIRLAIIVVGATNIAAATSVNQGQETMVLPIASSVPYAVTDSLGNLICPRDPQRKILGYRQIVANVSSSQAAAIQATGLSCPVIVPTGRRVTVRAFTFSETISSGAAYLEIWNGTVGSGTCLNIATLSTNGAMNACEGFQTPSSSSQTYNVGIENTGTNTTTLVASGIKPTFIKVELA